MHGYSDDADTWWRVGPALAAQGWTVVAPDLLGHGLAPRAGTYDLDALADDLVETVGTGFDLVLGHSLGGLLVNLAAADLSAERCVLVDPPWGELPGDRGRRLSTDGEPGPHLPAAWTPEDVEVDLRSNARLDPAVTRWVAGEPLAGRAVPVPPAAPSLVVAPESGPLVPPQRHAELVALGFQLLVVPHVGHVVHRDDPSLVVGLCASPRSPVPLLCAS